MPSSSSALEPEAGGGGNCGLLLGGGEGGIAGGVGLGLADGALDGRGGVEETEAEVLIRLGGAVRAVE